MEQVAVGFRETAKEQLRRPDQIPETATRDTGGGSWTRKPNGLDPEVFATRWPNG